ncbi:MAG: hypothetical protein CM15mP83_9750 [Flavobacteriaceae bacterium]|nr:MAG: hypothetical protein CM15mP83_9750 [Flavobacteriaceae bacterium]
MTMSKGASRNTSYKIEILLVVFIDNITATCLLYFKPNGMRCCLSLMGKEKSLIVLLILFCLISAMILLILMVFDFSLSFQSLNNF